MTEAAATLEYETYDYSLPHSKTVDMIGEEFIKKENGCDSGIQTQAGILQLAYSAASGGHIKTSYSNKTTSLPPLTYTTTTIPTISTLGCQVSSAETENGVLYCNLDDLSRYIPDNFSFDNMVEGMESDSVQESIIPDMVSRVQVLSLPTQPLPVSSVQSGPIQTSYNFVGRGSTLGLPNCQLVSSSNPTIQIQLKSGGASVTNNVQTLTFPTIDTTKLTGQLSVVHELPEVSKLVFQEVKQEHPDSIVNILENMKQEDPSSLSPLDYTVTSTSQPLNLVNNFAKGVKRVVAPVQNFQTQPDAKRMKNVIVVQGQNGQQIIQEVANHYEHQFRSSPSPGQDMLHQQTNHGLTSMLCIDPPSPNNNSIKREPKSKSNSPKLNISKSINSSTVPSSKTCNWIFENGQVCGKTFSKSYNLVVHMRMHEDIRPFACTLCDQTFRQKAHLQRHETTHGIQTKNFYRTPSSKKKKKVADNNGQMTKNLEERLAMVNTNLVKSNRRDDSEGEEYTHMEDEEEDMYLPHGGTKREPVRKYSDTEREQQVDSEMDSGHFLPIQGRLKTLTVEQMSDGSDGLNTEERDHLRLNRSPSTLGEAGDLANNNLMNLVVSRHDDDDTSTVQDILHTVNSVPTLEQKLESQSHYLNCDNLLLRALPSTKPIMSASAAPSYQPVTSSTFNQSTTSLPHITKLVESTSISQQAQQNPVSLSASLSTTSTQNLPGTSIPLSSLFHSPVTNNNPAGSNILFSTLSNPTNTSVSSSLQKSSLSFVESAVPVSSPANSFTNSITSGNRQLIIDNIDDHSPEIQAEILNAFLADETYGEDETQIEEIWEEEIFRLSSLPSTWWVSRRRKPGATVGDVTYYSPQGYSFKNRQEIQNFLQNNIVPKDLDCSGLRSPPLPLEQIPIIEENFVSKSSLLQQTMPSNTIDTNSIAQALIANLRPEPIESLKEALNLNLNSSPEPRQLVSPPHESSLHQGSHIVTCSANLLPMPTVS